MTGQAESAPGFAGPTTPAPSAAEPGPDRRVRVVYSDLDGTMVGPRGCFFRAADLSPTLTPAQALVELHAAGIALVLVSGRTGEQLFEAGAVFGADGWIAELGAVVGWDLGFQRHVLPGLMPADLEGTPMAVMERLGVGEALIHRYPGMVAYHAPWHESHEVDLMLRGRLDVGEVEAWLADQGLGWLRLRDNGVLPAVAGRGLDPRAVPPHVYHLMPDGISKGLAIQWDLARRGLGREQAVAIGDSVSDLEMAPFVGRLWLTANGRRHPEMERLAAAHPSVRWAAGEVGLGWAQAVRDALAS